MASQVEICNMALTLIGANTITAMDDDNDRARIADRFFDDTRDTVLRAHPWGFAKVRDSLTPDVDTPDWKYAYQFTLPADPYCLRVLELDEDYPGQIAYSVEGRKLLTDEATISLLYISRVITTGNFDALFVEALVAALAGKFAMALTRDESLVKMATELYYMKIQEARTIDGLESEIKEFYNATLTSIR